MGTDKKTDASKEQTKASKADSLIKTRKKGDVELSEEELARTPGGCGAGMSKLT